MERIHWFWSKIKAFLGQKDIGNGRKDRIYKVNVPSEHLSPQIASNVANILSTNQEIFLILWNTKNHYLVRIILSLNIILIQLSTIHFLFSLRSILILYFHLRVGLQSGLLPWRFLNNLFCWFITPPYVLHVNCVPAVLI